MMKKDRPDRDHIKAFGLALAAHLAWAVCESLKILFCSLGLPTKQLNEDWGCLDQIWCAHVHSELETRAWGAELAGRAK